MKRAPGRPSVNENEESVPVHVQMSVSQYDYAYQCALIQRCTVPEVIRRALRRVETDNKKPKID